jgi:hypothetical protein
MVGWQGGAKMVLVALLPGFVAANHGGLGVFSNKVALYTLACVGLYKMGPTHQGRLLPTQVQPGAAGILAAPLTHQGGFMIGASNMNGHRAKEQRQPLECRYGGAGHPWVPLRLPPTELSVDAFIGYCLMRGYLVPVAQPTNGATECEVRSGMQTWRVTMGAVALHLAGAEPDTPVSASLRALPTEGALSAD